MVDFFFQSEDGIRDLVRSRGLGDVYKRQVKGPVERLSPLSRAAANWRTRSTDTSSTTRVTWTLSLIHILTLPTSDLV
mgnify:CR=1 FL=1